VQRPDAQALGLLALHQLATGYYDEAIELADEGATRIGRMLQRGGTEVLSNLATYLPSAVSLARFVRLVAPCKDNTSSVPSQALDEKADDHLEQLLSPADMCDLLQPQCARQSPEAMVYQLIGWLYCFSRECRKVHSTDLPGYLVSRYEACLAWYESAVKSTSDQVS
jgi:hypothetical protein